MARMANAYDTPDAYAALIGPRFSPIADALVERASLRETHAALELGAGTGLVTRRAAPRVRTLLATDTAVAMLEYARRTIRHSPGLSFALVDYDEPLPFLDGSFDAVLSGLTFVQNSPASLREVARILKPRGFLALSVWGDSYHEKRLLNDAMRSLGGGPIPASPVSAALKRLERVGFRSVKRADLVLSNRFESVDDYVAYRRAFGGSRLWTRAFYERYLRALHTRASLDAAEDGSLTIGWTVSVLTARRPG